VKLQIPDGWPKKGWGLSLSLVLYVFAVMLAGMLLAVIIVSILDWTALIYIWDEQRWGQLGTHRPVRMLVYMAASSSFLGAAIAAFFSTTALKPIHQIIEATRKIAVGDFSVRVKGQGIRELDELSQSFNKMARELSSIEILRSDFVNNFSHEFKTPIVSIRGFAKLLKDGDLSEEEKREYLEIIIMESERLAALSTHILNLSKYEAMEIVAEKAVFPLDEQIRRVIVLAEAKWMAKHINIQIEMEEIMYNGDENLMQQIWINLVDNAIKFSKPEGNINVNLAVVGESVHFSIQDDGIGIDEESRLHIFDKFYQGDTSHRQAGNGLGLAMVKRIVELCNGTISVESYNGKGSIFIVTLPLF